MRVVDEYIPQPERETDKPFLMSVEDVFSIKGRGTVVTGRVDRGTLERQHRSRNRRVDGKDTQSHGDLDGNVPQDSGQSGSGRQRRFAVARCGARRSRAWTGDWPNQAASHRTPSS